MLALGLRSRLTRAPQRARSRKTPTSFPSLHLRTLPSGALPRYWSRQLARPPNRTSGCETGVPYNNDGYGRLCCTRKTYRPHIGKAITVRYQARVSVPTALTDTLSSALPLDFLINKVCQWYAMFAFAQPLRPVLNKKGMIANFGREADKALRNNMNTAAVHSLRTKPAIGERWLIRTFPPSLPNRAVRGRVSNWQRHHKAYGLPAG
jgi:hypothetical protein